MNYAYDENKRKLNISLDEDIDINSCKTLRTIIDGYIMRYSPKICELDMKQVGFMDSTGIGFVVGRKNLATMLGCKFVLTNCNGSIKKIMQMYDSAKKVV